MPGSRSPHSSLACVLWPGQWCHRAPRTGHPRGTENFSKLPEGRAQRHPKAKPNQSLGLCIPPSREARARRGRFLGCFFEKLFEVRLTQCFPKGNNTNCFGAGLELAPSAALRTGTCCQPRGGAGAFCTRRARLNLLSQNSNANRSSLPAENPFWEPGGCSQELRRGCASSSPRTPRSSHLHFAVASAAPEPVHSWR